MASFFKDHVSDSSSQSDESASLERGQNARKGMALEMFNSDSDEDTKRRVLTEKEKRFNKLKETISNMKQSTERHNFSSVETEFNTLIKEFDKSKKVIDETGIPNFFIRAIYLLEDKIKNFSAEDKQKLSAANSKSMVAISRKIKKLNAEIVASLKQFQENPTQTTEESSGSEKTESDLKSDSSNDSIHPLDSNDPLVRRQFWLLKKRKDSEISDKKASDDEKESNPEKDQPVEKKVHEFKVAEVEQEREITIDLTYEGRTNMLKEFVAGRTSKNFDLKYTYLVLNKYLQHYIAQPDQNELLTELILILIPIRVDYGKKIQVSHMTRELWQETFQNIETLLTILSVAENREKQYNTYQKEEDTKYYNNQHVLESISTFFYTLASEINKAFQNIETSTEEQYMRIKDLYELLRLGSVVQRFYDELNMHNVSVRISFLRLENMYYIHDTTLVQLREASIAKGESTTNHIYQDGMDTEKTIHDLATLVYKHDSVNRTRATLYHIYHHSIHGRVQVARDYLLMSKITDNVQKIESTLQTLYNRVLAQLGLAYFRVGNFQEAFNFLNDLCSAQGKIKELIGQAQLRYLSQNDKKKVLPQHQHLNVEMIEMVNFVCSMLIDAPILVSDPHNKSSLARMYRRLLDSYYKSHFVPAPEQNRDYIYMATKEMQRGNWKACYEYLMQMNIWKHLLYIDQTLKNLTQRVKEQSYKCYLLLFRNTFENLSLSDLVDKFELDLSSIKAITFKMISAQELTARVHTLDNQLYIVFEHSDRTTLQILSNRLVESVSQQQNLNQKILDKKIGNRESHQGDDQNDQKQNAPYQKTNNNNNNNNNEQNQKYAKKKIAFAPNNKPKTNQHKRKQY